MRTNMQVTISRETADPKPPVHPDNEKDPFVAGTRPRKQLSPADDPAPSTRTVPKADKKKRPALFLIVFLAFGKLQRRPNSDCEDHRHRHLNPGLELVCFRHHRHRHWHPNLQFVMGLYQLLEGLLLLANAVAILNEDRFLIPMGLGIADMSSGRSGSPLKTQLIGFVHATQYLRVPMVFANAVVIGSKLLFG